MKKRTGKVRRATKDLSQFRKQTAYMKFITTCIFPGGELDHIGLTVTNLERLGFEVHDVENWREHFAKTCRLWSFWIHKCVPKPMPIPAT